MSVPRLSVRQILHPGAVAVFGASEDREKFGGRIIYFLIQHGFAGRIVPINPRRKEIRGHAAFATLRDAPPGVEVAILAVPTSQLLTAIEQCAAAGVGCCVIITTGFAEADAAGAELQQRILDIAVPAGMRIVGPNCMGLINPGAQLALCSSIVLDTPRLLTGRIGLVSQSGALMVSLFDRAAGEGIGFSASVSLGNQSDLEICDFLEYFVDDSATDVRAARSHTASLAGSYDAFAAVCRAHGVVLVDDPVTMIRVADLLLRYPRLDVDGIGLLSGSGGGTGIMVDRIGGAGLRLARLSPMTRAALGELLLPPQADNPVDLGGRLPTQSDEIAAPALRTLAADPDVGLLLLYLTSMPGFAARTRTLAEAALKSGKPVLSVMLPGAAAEKPRAVLREVNCPYFDSVEDLLAVLRGMFDYYRFAPTISTSRRPADLPTSLPSLTDLAQLIAAYGIAVPRAMACATSDQAIASATTIGFPVVLKGSVSGVTHKTELQAVKLGLDDAADVAAAWQGIVASIAAHGLTDGVHWLHRAGTDSARH